ncbi:hypothetical protein B0T26DRAFT_735285 [Lasiosphaeria miniovina]|uniref:Uncharacterized protein n=1 Tax=Lasiosphaeria miniovina TaxID=1954250 RepID=A0AA39ZQT8_9PEZI|nr:uncharacterized protein B0T26DRAFT_735285 [Lasiosphaeria miniovina]KAK0701937.1 hypothetical protein B0T26DRAFT_735285 [Lasiosphaeria miniovina]
MVSCPRCRERGLSCQAPPGAKSCSECLKVSNPRCGLEGPDYRAFQTERDRLEAEEESILLLEEQASALMAKVVSKKRRVRRERKTFEERVTKAYAHEDSAIAELEEEERPGERTEQGAR